jgi:hypothetical protein
MERWPDPDRPDGPADADPASPDTGYDWDRVEWLPDSWESTEPIEPTRKVDRFRRTTAGAIVAAGLIGVEKVFMPEREEQPAITWESPGEPPGLRQFEFDLDPDDPAASTITVRPWVVAPHPPHQG